jgi:multidrug efflux pump subunit AcrA (membrane-fusion protein)
VPVGEQQQSLAVPSSAVQHHEVEAFVFVEEKPSTFRRVDVTTGLETADWIAITSGLRPGLLVVEEGAFFLKSELLLEAEE